MKNQIIKLEKLFEKLFLNKKPFFDWFWLIWTEGGSDYLKGKRSFDSLAKTASTGSPRAGRYTRLKAMHSVLCIWRDQHDKKSRFDMSTLDSRLNHHFGNIVQLNQTFVKVYKKPLQLFELPESSVTHY